ncbi:MAG TPA: ATP-binding protein, partial [bacterium]|nr:ATP-binding protein [bacterium]
MLTEKQKPVSFVGRQYEQAGLLQEFEKPRASLVVIHGRRRVGKTRLLHEFCRDKNTLWVEGLEKGTPQGQRTHFIKQLAEQTIEPFLSRTSSADWTEAFDCLKELLNVLKKSKMESGKMILVFDEFPWLINQDEKIVALFKYYWDNFFKEHNLMIILCGSINTFMVKKVIQSSALYGRLHHEIRLDPLTPKELSLFLGSALPKKDVVEYTMIFGGIPRYWEEINPQESVVQNINRLCFLKDAFFVREFARLFREEFGSINIYTAIVLALSKTSSLNYTEILKQLKTSVGGGYQEYLDNLSLASFVRAFTPLNKKKTRLVRYRLWDE